MMDLYQLHVNNAFLHGYLHEEVYMEIPQGLKGESSVFVAVYVDDVILTGTNLEEIKALKTYLHNQFKIKDLGKLHYFLGLEMLYKDDGVLISQRKFTTDLLKEYDCLGYSAVSSPLYSSTKLRAEEGTLLSDPSYYRKLVGKLNFLTNTRLDIAYSIQHLSQFMQAPRKTHLKDAIHVLRYLKNDLTLGIFLSNDPSYKVTTYCDSDWAACPDSRRSVSGYLVLFGGSPISWKSKKQTTVSLSSAEAEYRSLRKVVGELVWVQRLLEELTVPCTNHIQVFCDSQAVVHIARNHVFYERTKHIKVDWHFMQDKLHDGLITLNHISTHDQLADILAKALTGIKHSDLLDKCMPRNSSRTGELFEALPDPKKAFKALNRAKRKDKRQQHPREN
ncbi:uncharacterized mitochondrial protein AtMg00810-like [Nicotiana tomentosiformis]|uniref:uncharacterized mitochondrial protein AtMg00810-like n=1 Tax=Nicotiana tomentosiformis TaxID=4098 RepID=UPI00388C69E1